MIHLQRFKNLIDYIIIYFVIAFTANEYFMQSKKFFAFFTITMLGLSVLRKRTIYHKKFVLIFLILLVIQISQVYVLGEFYFRSFLSVIFLYLMSYLAIVIIDDFDVKYVKLVYVLSIVSLVNFTLMFVPGYESFISSFVNSLNLDPVEGQNMLLLTYENGKILGIIPRNAGFVYEPGIYSFVLVIAMLFEYKNTGKVFSRRNIVFFISLISTFSTSAYLFLFLFISFSVFQFKINGFVKILLFIIAIFSFYHFYFTLNFLGEKVEKQMYSVNGRFVGNRFQSAYEDLVDFSKSPIVGRGRNRKTRFDIQDVYGETKLSHRTNGITDFLVEYGIVFFILFYIILFSSIKLYLKEDKFTIFFFLGIVLITFSQTVYSRPLMVSLLFINLIQRSYNGSPKNIHLYSGAQQN